jgi:chromosome segregation ATPase
MWGALKDGLSEFSQELNASALTAAEQAQKALDAADQTLQGVDVEENLDDLEDDGLTGDLDESITSVTRSHTGDEQEELQFWKSAFREVEKQLEHKTAESTKKDQRIKELENQAEQAVQSVAKMQRLIGNLKQEIKSLRHADEGLLLKLVSAAKSFAAERAMGGN